MSFSNFLSRFKGAGKKEQLLEVLRGDIDLLRDNVIPSYRAASQKAFGRSAKFKSVDLQGMEVTARRLIKNLGTGNMIDGYHQRFEKMVPLAGKLYELTEQTFNPDVLPEAATYQQSTLLLLNDMVSFTANYSLALLSYVYIMETAATSGLSDADVREQISAGDQKYVVENYVRFCTAINTLSVEIPTLVKDLKEVPMAVVKETDQRALTSTMGAKKVDPFNVGFIALNWNPFYYIGKMIVEYQVKRYKLNQARRQELQLRLQQLLQTQRDNPSPIIDKEIDMLQQRIDRLNSNIRKEEDNV